MNPYSYDEADCAPDCGGRCCDGVVAETEPCGCTRNQYGDHLTLCQTHTAEYEAEAFDAQMRAAELAAGWDPTP